MEVWDIAARFTIQAIMEVVMVGCPIVCISDK